MVAGDPRVPNNGTTEAPIQGLRWFHGARLVKVEDYKVLPPRYKLVYIGLVYIPMKTIDVAEMDI